MLCICKLPEEEQRFVIFDKTDFDPVEFNIEKEKEITYNELTSEYCRLPILSLNDFLLRTIRPKSRTTSHVLGELHIDSFEQLEHENGLIELKKSKLSKSQRDIVQWRYDELLRMFNKQVE